MADAIRYAMIKDGIVQNISLWNGDTTQWEPPQDMIVIPAPDHIGVGWAYDGATWTMPITAEDESE